VVQPGCADRKIKMKIKLVYDSQDAIPENVRELYTEENGKWKLTGVEGMKTQADVDAMARARDNEKAAHQATKQKFAAFDGMDLDEVQEKLDKFEEYKIAAEGKMDQAKIDELVEAKIKSRLAPVERERDQLKTKTAELEKSTGELQNEIVSRDRREVVSKALAESKVIDTAREDAIMLSERVFEKTEDGKFVTKDGVGVTPGLEPGEWLKEIAEKRPHWWEPAKGTGTTPGSRGPGGLANPWSKENWSLTSQGAFIREHGQEKAAQYAKAAGSMIGATAPPAPEKQ
jgi:hypothetical protein